MMKSSYTMPFAGSDLDECEHKRGQEELEAYLNADSACAQSLRQKASKICALLRRNFRRLNLLLRAARNHCWNGMQATLIAQNAAPSLFRSEVAHRVNARVAAQIIFRASTLLQLCL